MEEREWGVSRRREEGEGGERGRTHFLFDLSSSSVENEEVET